MWAVKHKDDGIISDTLSDTREGAYWCLYDIMDEDFRKCYWKKPELSRKQYSKLGYKAVKVELVEVKK